jgi:hypothetical protein
MKKEANFEMIFVRLGQGVERWAVCTLLRVKVLVTAAFALLIRVVVEGTSR